MCSNSTLLGRPWCNEKPPWIHDSGRVKKHQNRIKKSWDYVGMRPTSGVGARHAWRGLRRGSAGWPVQAPSSLFPCKNEHYFDTSGSWNHQGFVHHKGDKESLRNTASKVAFWRVSRNPTNYCPKSMKFGYLFPWKTRGKRVSPRALLKSSKMISKNHQSGDRRKTNFSTAIMTIIWTPLNL